MTEKRSQTGILQDIEELCLTSGYIYVLAWVSFRDNIIAYCDEMNISDMDHLFSSERLIRTEISTLAGLMCKGTVDLDCPSSDDFQKLVERTDALMCELHHSFIARPNPEDLKEGIEKIFTQENFYREAFFYSGEPAYYFQFRDFAPQKYANDNSWFENYKSYSIEDFGKAIRAICAIFHTNFENVKGVFGDGTIHSDKLLDLFTITESAVSAKSGLSVDIVRRILSDFSLNPPCNNSFQELHDFNEYNAKSLIPIGDERYIIFNLYSIAEAFYESPYYWMAGDKTYIDTAMKNRGRFNEAFAAEKLRRVFGKDKVFENVNILRNKKEVAGEIDVLVVYCDRAIVLQAKSKKLTLESRKGNDKKIRDDFQQSIQDSYDQGYLCATLLNDPAYTLVDLESSEVVVSKEFREIFIICTVLDSYPALSFQARQFLKYNSHGAIKPPFVMDVFLLDVLAEMLVSPLRFLSYINTRALYLERVMSTHELTVFSYHLRKNLYITDEVDLVHLHDDVSSHLDLSMMVRRDGVQGPRTPDGILTRFEGTLFSQLLEELTNAENEAAINLGFLLLGIGESSIKQINLGLGKIIRATQKDGNNHDFGIGISGTGITFHCNKRRDKDAQEHIMAHCLLKKYAQKAHQWFGVVLCHKGASTIRMVVQNMETWKYDEEMEKLTPPTFKKMTSDKLTSQKNKSTGDIRKRKRKLGRIARKKHRKKN